MNQNIAESKLLEHLNGSPNFSLLHQIMTGAVRASTYEVLIAYILQLESTRPDQAVIETLVEALEVARNRVEYLGLMHTDRRHEKSNDETFLPRLDAALVKARAGGR